MYVHELKEKFFQFREFETDDANELLDFAKRAYIHDEISICEYRKLVRELESLGAVIPEFNQGDTLFENTF